MSSGGVRVIGDSYPRDLTMAELAEKFGISQQALSKRLRGGHGTLITNSLTIQTPDNETDD